MGDNFSDHTSSASGIWFQSFGNRVTSFAFRLFCYLKSAQVIFKCLASFEPSAVHFRMPCVGPRPCLQASTLGAGDVCILYTSILTGHCARSVVLWFTGSLHDELSD